MCAKHLINEPSSGIPLTEGQLFVVRALNCVPNKPFLLLGHPGTGKTTLLSHIQGNLICTAVTGAGARGLPLGSNNGKIITPVTLDFALQELSGTRKTPARPSKSANHKGVHKYVSEKEWEKLTTKKRVEIMCKVQRDQRAADDRLKKRAENKRNKLVKGLSKLMKKQKTSKARDPPKETGVGTMHNTHIKIDDRHHTTLVVDEVSMMNRRHIAQLIKLCKKHVNLRIVFVGDVFQLPPVDSCWFFEAPEWKAYFVDRIICVGLSEIKRFASKELMQCCTDMRNGVFTTHVSRFLYDVTKPVDSDIRAIEVVGRNAKGTEINERSIRDVMRCAHKENVPVDMVNVIRYRHGSDSDGRAGNGTLFVLGAPYMITQNIYDGKRQLIAANGNTGILVDMDGIVHVPGQDIPITLKMSQTGIKIDHDITSGYPLDIDTRIRSDMRARVRLDQSGKTVVIPTVVPYDSSGENQSGGLAFPLVAAYAVTAHKMQGLTVCRPLHVHVGDFTSIAQLIVAVTRVTDIRNLRLIDYSEERIEWLLRKYASEKKKLEPFIEWFNKRVSLGTKQWMR